MNLFLLIKLNKRQIEKLSDIASDVGLVALASVVIPALLDKFNVLAVILGLMIALGFWTISLILKK